MTTIRITSLALLLSLLITLALPQTVTAASLSSPQESLLNDAFGYILNPGAPFIWNDITGSGQKLLFDDDDNATNLRSLGFAFPFYEFTYTHIHVSIDGAVYMGSANPPVIINIRPLPFESPPNAVVAPLWEDLALVLDSDHADGEIWVKAGGSYPNRTYTVQWNNVYRLGSGYPLTFQLVLKENGDIQFQYHSIGDLIPDIPIGIEDADGIDGIQYNYSVQDLTSQKAIYISRPGPGPRLKAFPVMQGGFMETQRLDFEITVRNTGTTTDNYLLSHEIIDGNDGWNLKFHQGGPAISQTGTIAPGAESVIRVTMGSPFAPIAGDYARARIKFQSSTNSGKYFYVTVQGAVPSEFTKVFYQHIPASTTVLFRSQANGQQKYIQAQSPDDLSIMRIGGGKYLVTSDDEDSNGYSNIHFTFIDTSLNQEFVTYFVQNNIPTTSGDGCETEPILVRDLAPSTAITPDGSIGVLFIRERLMKVKVGIACAERLNSNIMFALVKPSGVDKGPFQITDNTAFGTQQSIGVDFYTSPTIAATADNRFTVAWSRTKYLSDGRQVRDLYMSTVTPAAIGGSEGILPPLQLTHGEMEFQRFYDPVLTSLRGGGTALVTSAYKTDWKEFYYRVYYLNNDGSISAIQVLDRGMQGVHSDILQLRNGNLLLAYSTPDYRGIGYALITPDRQVFRCQLPPSGGDTLDYVSLTTDPAGNGVLTWADRLTSRHYYTLIAPNPPAQSNQCVLLTPPMIYGNWPVGDTLRSHYNQFNTTAPLGSPNLFIPLIGQ